MKLKIFILALFSILFVGLQENNVYADSTITYKNMQLYSVDNEHNAIKIKYSDISSQPETIHEVPGSIRQEMSEIFQSSNSGTRDKKFNITVSDHNKFETMSYVKSQKYEKSDTIFPLMILGVGIIILVSGIYLKFKPR